jgi:hypothetical protein
MLNTMLHTFERRKIDPHRLYGAIVAESEELLLIQRMYDFDFDGYMVIRRRDITKSYSSDSDAYCEQLMRDEGLWKTPTKAVRALPLSDWQTLLTALRDKPVVIENERKGDFFIGPILECEAKTVTIHHFDGCGEWQKPERLSYRAITSVQFGSRYIMVHSRHLPPRPRQAVKTRRRQGTS